MKNFISIIISSIILVTSSIISFHAADVNKLGEGKSKVVANVNASTFSVTVPTILPVNVDKDNNVTVAENANVVNNSNGPVKIANVFVEANNDWKLVDFNTDFKKKPVNTREFGMVINESNVSPNGDVSLSGFHTINGKNSHNIKYNANIAIQSSSINEIYIGKVVFTVAWNDDMVYYSNFKTAMKDANNLTNDNADLPNAENAAVGMYISEEIAHVCLLKDVSLSSIITVNSDVDFNGNGKTIENNGFYLKLCGQTDFYNAKIKQTNGPGIVSPSYTSGINIRHVNVEMNVNKDAKNYGIVIESQNSTIDDCNVTINGNVKTGTTYGILVNSVAKNLKLSKVNIKANGDFGKFIGIYVGPQNSDFEFNIKDVNIDVHMNDALGVNGYSHGIHIMNGIKTNVDGLKITMDEDQKYDENNPDGGFYGIYVSDGNNETILSNVYIDVCNSYNKSSDSAKNVGIITIDTGENSKLYINESKGPVYISGGSSGIVTTQTSNTEIYIDGGEYYGACHGGLYLLCKYAEIKNAKIGNSEALGIVEPVDGVEGNSANGASYFSGSGTFDISNCQILGIGDDRSKAALHGIRLRENQGTCNCVVNVYDSFVSGKCAFSADIGTININSGVTTDYISQEIEPSLGTVNDNR